MTPLTDALFTSEGGLKSGWRPRRARKCEFVIIRMTLEPVAGGAFYFHHTANGVAIGDDLGGAGWGTGIGT